MRKVIIVFICGLLLWSCQKTKTPGALNISEDFTVEQIDSLGKIFEPKIGSYGGTLRLPLAQDPDSFCPATSQSAYSSEITYQNIFEGLVTLDVATHNHKPHIAKKWDVSEDGMVWTFYLRDNVYFSDGVKLSAYDIEFTYNDIIYNETIRSPLRFNFSIRGKKIDIVAVDSFTVTFTLPYPYAPFLTVAGHEIMPKHVYSKYVKDGTLEQFLDKGTDVKNVVGSGPFILEKYELGQRVILTRNPNYWQKDKDGNRLPYIDKLLYLIINEPNVQMLKFKNGDIDHLSIDGKHYPILKPVEKEKGIRLYKVGPSWKESFFIFNQNNQKNEKINKYYLEEKKQKWFRNKNFRKACAYAINYDAMINIVYNGLAYPPTGVWGKHKGKFHNPDAIVYNYNVEKAKELLKQENFIDSNGDGFLEDKDGNMVEFTLTTSAGVKRIEETFGLVRKDLESIGLKVHLSFIEFNNLIDRINNTYDWDVVAYGSGGPIDPHFWKSSVISSSFRYAINPKQKSPSYPWEARIDKIFELGESEMDSDKRNELYDEWQEITMEQCLKVYLPIKEVVVGVNDKIGNIILALDCARSESLILNNKIAYFKE